MFRKRPNSTGKSISFMKVKKPIPGLIDAMRAFWGLPMMVRLLPMFELVATAIKNGKVLCAPRRLQRFITKGVSIKQVVSLVSTADVAADKQHKFTSIFVGEAVSKSSSTYFQMPVSCKEQVFILGGHPKLNIETIPPCPLHLL